MINKLIIKVVAAFLVLNSFLIAQELSKEDKESLEILLLAKVVKAQNDNSILPLTVDINNNLSLSGRNKYISYNNCFTNDIEKSYSNVPTQLYKLLANLQDALAINSLYSNYQVKNLSTLVKVHVDEYFKNKNLVINEKCENNKPTNLNYTNSMNSDVLAIPRYLYAYLLQTQEFSTLNDTHVLFKTIKYDDLKNASDKVIEKKNKIENEYAKLVDNYNKNSNNDNKNFVGSLVIS